MKRLPRIPEIASETAKGMLKGVGKGGAVGAAASLATGAAVIVTAPGWIPVIGGTMAVSAAVVAFWAGVGAAVGGATGGIFSFLKRKKLDRDFEKVFVKRGK